MQNLTNDTRDEIRREIADVDVRQLRRDILEAPGGAIPQLRKELLESPDGAVPRLEKKIDRLKIWILGSIAAILVQILLHHMKL